MRALTLNEDGLGVTSKVDDLLRDLLGAAQRAFERRFARSTARLDKSYWRFWTQCGARRWARRRCDRMRQQTRARRQCCMSARWR